MEIATIAAIAVSGAVAGHLMRRILPALLGLKDRSLPFETPWLEICGGLIFGSIRGLDGSPNLYLLAGLLLLACAADYRAKLIPDLLTFGGALLGLAISAYQPGPISAPTVHRILLEAWGFHPYTVLGGLMLAAVGALFGFAFLELLRRTFGLLAGIEAMGMGDSKLLMLIGAFLGPLGALLGAALGFLFGVVHGLVYLKLLKQPHSPFGPPLALGALTYALAGPALAALFESFQGWVLRMPSWVLLSLYAVLLGAAIAMIVRTRRNASVYADQIEADYERIESELEAEPADPRNDEEVLR